MNTLTTEVEIGNYRQHRLCQITQNVFFNIFFLLEFESDKRFVNSAGFTQCDVLLVLFFSSAENKMWDFSGWRNWNLKLQLVPDGLTSVHVNDS